MPLIAARAEYQISTGNDADADRHGIVTPDAGLMKPNHALVKSVDVTWGRQRQIQEWSAPHRRHATEISPDLAAPKRFVGLATDDLELHASRSHSTTSWSTGLTPEIGSQARARALWSVGVAATAPRPLGC
ncbi:hypothetical protein ACLQ26_30845 [Micromonospora sp. DT43]|uniref:hypothetical protein n=1 Tax=Micromonospora sp. DT43 TaxID=3393440 RepID=UPI003CEA9FA8